jgi:hypothetical protein
MTSFTSPAEYIIYSKLKKLFNYENELCNVQRSGSYDFRRPLLY